MSIEDMLDNQGVANHPADASTVEAPRPDAEAATAGLSDSPSDEFEDEPKVPVHVLIETRRKMREYESLLHAEKQRASDIEQRLGLWEAAVPEIQDLAAQVSRAEQEKADLEAERDYLRQVADAARDAGLELPDQEQHQLSKTLKAINARLQAMEQLPAQVQSQLNSLSRRSEAERMASAQREAAERARVLMNGKFEKEWDSAIAVAPEIDELKDIMFERYARDGGTKPVDSYLGGLMKLARTSRGRVAAERQGVRTTAASGSAGTSPRSKDPALPNTFNEFWKQNGL